MFFAEISLVLQNKHSSVAYLYLLESELFLMKLREVYSFYRIIGIVLALACTGPIIFTAKPKPHLPLALDACFFSLINLINIYKLLVIL